MSALFSEIVQILYQSLLKPLNGRIYFIPSSPLTILLLAQVDCDLTIGKRVKIGRNFPFSGKKNPKISTYLDDDGRNFRFKEQNRSKLPS